MPAAFAGENYRIWKKSNQAVKIVSFRLPIPKINLCIGKKEQTTKERCIMTKKYQVQAFNGKTVEVSRGFSKLKIEAIAPEIFHIFMETAADFPSYAIDHKPLPVELTEKTEGRRRYYDTGSMGIAVEEDGFDFVTQDGQTICRTFRGEIKRPERLAPDFLSFWSVRDIRQCCSRSRQKWKWRLNWRRKIGFMA